jgi:broad specificity phosphatase PhoE
MTTRVSFVRHGEADNPQNVYYGRLPGFGLSVEGRRQAQHAAVYLAKRVTTSGLPSPSSPQTPPASVCELAAIYCSPLRRAHQTATILAERLPGLSPVISPYLTEVYTPFDGQPRTVMRARDWDFYTGTQPPYEQPLDVVARVRRFIAQARARHPGQHVVAVTHGDVVTFLLLWAMGRPVEHAHKADVARLGIETVYPSPASISLLSFETDDEDERPRIEYVNPYA